MNVSKVSLFLAVMLLVVIFGSLISSQSDVAYEQSCEKLKSGSRFAGCKDLGDNKIRLCQEWGNRTFRNRTFNFDYCEDYKYEKTEENITIIRVR